VKPELQGLCRIRWQLFCTFTLKSDRVPERVLRTMFFATARKKAGNFGVHFSKLVWCLRLEIGESTGRRHLHALITGLPPYAITERGCRATESIWGSVGGGHAVVRVFDPYLAGVDYILKGLEQAELAWSQQGANLYEFTKFGRTGDVTLSESAIRVAMGRRYLAKTRKPASTVPSGVIRTPEPASVETSPPVTMPRKGPEAGLQGHKQAERSAQHIRWVRGFSVEQAAATLPAVTRGET
jgi:hypothetical protein